MTRYHDSHRYEDGRLKPCSATRHCHDRRRYEDGKLKKPLPTPGDLVFAFFLIVAMLVLGGWGLKQAATELIRQTVYEMQNAK